MTGGEDVPQIPPPLGNQRELAAVDERINSSSVLDPPGRHHQPRPLQRGSHDAAAGWLCASRSHKLKNALSRKIVLRLRPRVLSPDLIPCTEHSTSSGHQLSRSISLKAHIELYSSSSSSLSSSSSDVDVQTHERPEMVVLCSAALARG